jgi:V-type H+-transporting ATPase subunit E
VSEEAKQRLHTITKDKAGYSKIIQSLLTQGACQLLEPLLLVRCRQADQSLIENAISPALAEYKAKVNKEVVIKLDTENWLSPSCAGGMEMIAMKGKIKVDNTLEARLGMISEQIMPDIRTNLFGANPNRKFND